MFSFNERAENLMCNGGFSYFFVFLSFLFFFANETHDFKIRMDREILSMKRKKKEKMVLTLDECETESEN